MANMDDVMRAKRGEKNLCGADLREADLSRLDLSGVDLSKARMVGTDLQAADLRRVNLRGAQLWNANLDGADLTGALYDFSTKLPDGFQGNGLVGPKADLGGLDLSKLNLDAADLREARYDAETRWPEGFDYRNSGAVGPGANLSGLDLAFVDFRGVDLAEAQYDDSTKWPYGFDPQAAGAISDNPYYRELVDFRQTLQEWLNGSTPAENGEGTFARLQAVVPEDMIHIRGNGAIILDPNESLNGFRQAHGEMPDFKMWLEDFRLRWEISDLALVTFKEFAQIGDNIYGLLSTVVFRKNPDTPFGVEWLHYQETILPETE